MTNEELYAFINNEACKNNYDDYFNFIHISKNIKHSKIKNLKINFLNDGGWLNDEHNSEKHEFIRAHFHVTSDEGHDFYIYYSQNRNGNFHSDYIYSKPLICFVDKEKYEFPVIAYTFVYKNHIISCADRFNSTKECAFFVEPDNNEYKTIEFNSVEKAIEHVDSIVKLNKSIELYKSYDAIKDMCKKIDLNEKLNIPKCKIYLACSVSDSKDLEQIRNTILPICIEYKLEQISFWEFIKNKSKK